MTTTAAKMTVLAGKDFACVKISGRANFTSSIDFRTLVTELHSGGIHFFAIDLAECVLMDSTFLGVLTGFGLKINDCNGSGEKCAVQLVNPNPRVAELLENLGVAHLFTITNGPLTAPEPVSEREAKHSDATPVQLTRACLEAHQTLMQLSPENAARFKDVARFLAEDLKKHKGDGSAENDK